MSTCFPTLSHMTKKVIFPVPTTCETNPESIRGFYDWLIWPLSTKMGITSSRKFGSIGRKLGWKLDFRGFKSIGGRTHSSIRAERYGPRNIDDLHCNGLPLREPERFRSGIHCFCTTCMPLCGNWQQSFMMVDGHLHKSPSNLRKSPFFSEILQTYHLNPTTWKMLKHTN